MRFGSHDDIAHSQQISRVQTPCRPVTNSGPTAENVAAEDLPADSLRRVAMLIPVLTLILVFSLLRLFLWRCLNAERRSECNTKNSAHPRYSHSLHVSLDSATPSEMASAQAVTH